MCLQVKWVSSRIESRSPLPEEPVSKTGKQESGWKTAVS